MSSLRPLHFGSIMKATYVDRPNRFLVRCHNEERGEMEAFLPNPGRLWELLLPQATLYVAVAPAAPPGIPSARRTRFTVLAVERDGEPVFLDTHANNSVARFLVDQGLIPTLQSSRVVRSEVPALGSRFDFLIRDGVKDSLMEVKSCTLFGNRVAMFPDAITARGRKHLLELAKLGERGRVPTVLFLIHTQRVDWFMPDFHTDLEFSRALLNVKDRLRILPVAIGWHDDLTMSGPVREISIPWQYLEREMADRGSYILLLHLSRGRRIPIGRLGNILFPAGYWLYVGSAMRSLSKRIARHKGTRKTFRWHIDYLRDYADYVECLPIRSSQRFECAIARALAMIFEAGPKGFGSSDCSCPTHLFRTSEHPFQMAPFHDILQGFRMRHPDT